MVANLLDRVRFNSIRSKTSPDASLLKYCSTDSPKRNSPGDGSRSSKIVNYQYFIEPTAGNRIEVCRQTLIGVLGITKHKVEGFLQDSRQNPSYPCWRWL